VTGVAATPYSSTPVVLARCSRAISHDWVGVNPGAPRTRRSTGSAVIFRTVGAIVQRAENALSAVAQPPPSDAWSASSAPVIPR
jgi:hypothetical protein